MHFKMEKEPMVVSLSLLSAAMLAGQFLGIHIITRISFALSFINVVLLWVTHLRMFTILDLLAGIIIILSFVSIIVTCKDLRIDYFDNWLFFCIVFLYFSVCLKIEIEYRTVKKVFMVNSITVAICLLSYIIRYNDAFYRTNSGVKYLKFDFYNPNTLALFLLCIAFSGIILFSVFYDKKRAMLAQVIYICFFLVLITQTLSRTALLAFLAFVVVFFLFRRKKRYYLPRSGVFNAFVTIFPLLFAYVYLNVIDRIKSSSFWLILIREGKELDSRETVWQYAIDLFEASPIFGAYGDIIESSAFSHMHNSHLNVLASYGALTFAFVLIFLYIVLCKASERSRIKHTELSVWAFIACLLLGSGEAVLFSGGLSFYILVGHFLLLCNMRIDFARNLRK